MKTVTFLVLKIQVYRNVRVNPETHGMQVKPVYCIWFKIYM